MDQKINTILDDLYHIDPNFKKHEKQLRTIVMDLISSKPDTHFDTKFALKLREELMRASAKSVVSPYSSPVAQFSFYSLR